MLQVTFDRICFIDSLSFFEMALSTFPRTFGLTDLKRGSPTSRQATFLTSMFQKTKTMWVQFPACNSTCWSPCWSWERGSLTNGTTNKEPRRLSLTSRRLLGPQRTLWRTDRIQSVGSSHHHLCLKRSKHLTLGQMQKTANNYLFSTFCFQWNQHWLSLQWC